MSILEKEDFFCICLRKKISITLIKMKDLMVFMSLPVTLNVTDFPKVLCM